MTAGLPAHLRQLADDSADRWSTLLMDQPPTPSESFTLAFKRASWAELVMRDAAVEIDRLRLELKAIEHLADPYGPSPGDLIRLLGHMAHKALQ